MKVIPARYEPGTGRNSGPYGPVACGGFTVTAPFIRRFHLETGLSPTAWLTSARLDWARELLETTAVPVERIAGLSGLGSPAALRATFHRHVGTSPHDYRALFRH